MRNTVSEEDEEARKAYLEEIEDSLVTMEETMNGRKMIAEEKHPSVKWAGIFEFDPNVKGLIPEIEKLIGLAKSLQMKWKAAASTK
ncbi:hypothetical protein K1719_017457 [Acacia pycnantha]|nr:hypothetical protein K1719_017457 [Acacia pycnantha]